MYIYFYVRGNLYIHATIHTYTHTFIHTYMHTRMHTHTCNIIYCMVSLTIGEFKVRELRGRSDRAQWCPVCRRHVVALPARTSAAAVVPLGSLPAKRYQCHVEMLSVLRPLHHVVTPLSLLAAWPSLRLVAGENWMKYVYMYECVHENARTHTHTHTHTQTRTHVIIKLCDMMQLPVIVKPWSIAIIYCNTLNSVCVAV